MQKLWLTADLHLGHGNIVKYCKRPFLPEAEIERVESEGRRDWRVSDESVSGVESFSQGGRNLSWVVSTLPERTDYLR
jgi:hypothetical protein